jgi:hypothetical protein
MQMRFVPGEIRDLKQPGDYLFNSRCIGCDVHGTNQAPEDGGAIPHHYTGCTDRTPRIGFIVFCKCGNVYASAREHRILSRDPLTVRASWLRLKGCHSWITDGIWSDC